MTACQRGISNLISQTLHLMGAGGGDLTDEFLTANAVRVTHRGQLLLAGAVKGIYDNLKALRDGKAPAELRRNVASSELMGQLTRRAHYDRWTYEYLKQNIMRDCRLIPRNERRLKRMAHRRAWLSRRPD